ncbi:MAG: PorV/PorQ family protein [Cyclobacteriaceae bacterium]|nr:PorV/PorQ family protein [Cyclobacteriaceae bacterium]
MRKSENFILLLLCTFFLKGGLEAQIRVPKYSNEFLSIGVGARGQGMGNTQTSLVNDATAGYWNPSALNEISGQHNLVLMHSVYFGGIANYDFAGFATTLDSLSTFGVSVIRFGIDDIPDTRFLYDANGAINYDNIRFFSAADYAFLLSYARDIPAVPGLTLGGNFKVIHRAAGDFATAWGFGLDAAVSWKLKGWRLGVVGKDISGTFNAWTHSSSLLADVYARTGNTIPENSIELTLPQLWIGVAHDLISRSSWSVLLALDTRTTFDGPRNVLFHSAVFSMDPSLGLEGEYKETVYLRAGVGKYQKATGISGEAEHLIQPDFGLGFSYDRFTLDYALTNATGYSNSLYSHVVSIKVDLGDYKSPRKHE